MSFKNTMPLVTINAPLWEEVRGMTHLMTVGKEIGTWSHLMKKCSGCEQIWWKIFEAVEAAYNDLDGLLVSLVQEGKEVRKNKRINMFMWKEKDAS